MSIAGTWGVIAGAFAVAALAKAVARGRPNVPHLSSLEPRDEPINLLPWRSVWKRPEVP